MSRRARRRLKRIALLGAPNAVNPNWGGAPLVLNPNDTAIMPQSPNGSAAFVYQNTTTENNAGTLAFGAGSSPRSYLPAPALLDRPGLLLGNWHANSLSIANLSPQTNTPIRIQLMGPGLPGTPLPLPANGTAVALFTYQCTEGTAPAAPCQLLFEYSTDALGVFVLIGGPPDANGNNAYAFEVNATASTGPGTGRPAPAGYYATAIGNSITFSFDWAAPRLFVANLSPELQPPVPAHVLLRQL